MRPLYVAAGFVLASVVLVAGTLHQVSYLVALPFQAAANIPGAVAFDPLEPVIAVLYAVATAALLAGADGDKTRSTASHCRINTST